MKFMKILLGVLFLALAAVAFRFFNLGEKSMSMKERKTLSNSSLAPCGDKPNCVSSTNERDEKNYLAPLKAQNNPISQIAKICEDENIKILETQENYIYGTYTSKVFRFVDDIEFFYDKSTQLLHYRSASRVGYSDLGANRKRIDRIIAKTNYSPL